MSLSRVQTDSSNSLHKCTAFVQEHDALVAKLNSLFKNSNSGSFDIVAIKARMNYQENYGYCYNIHHLATQVLSVCKMAKINHVHEVMCGYGLVAFFAAMENPQGAPTFHLSDDYCDKYKTKPNPMLLQHPKCSEPEKKDAVTAISEIDQPNSLVLMVWPPCNTSAGADALQAILENDNVSYVISVDEARGGCVANDDYFDMLTENFACVKDLDLGTRYPGIYDGATLYRKK